MGGPLRRGLVAGVIAGALFFGWRALRLDEIVDREAQSLESVASAAAAEIDGDAHRGIGGADDPAFIAIRDHLRRVQDRHGVRSPIYTLRRDGDRTRFVVMTNPTPFVGDPYELRPEMRPVFEDGRRGRTGLYGDSHGTWISGYGPVRDSAGRVVALVSVDRPSEDLAQQRTRDGLLAIPVALVAGVLAALIPALMRRREGLVAGAARVFRGSLAVRIGLAGTLSVVVAVAVSGLLQHGEARRRTVERLTAQLLSAVRMGALQIDMTDHERVARTGDAGGPAFARVRDALRRVQEAADLKSPVYTLRRDGELTRFVVMTNETPFVGHTNELRDGVRRTFESGGPGAEGPYTNATGTWISAWAPLVGPDGRVSAVLQADHEVETLLMALANESLRQLLFALAGVGVAFLTAFYLARGIARPIRRVAEAAGRIQGGDFDVSVPEDRADEVGELQAAINRMARGLRERERLRTMFGRYMAVQVASQLIDAGELKLEGELRTITVMISDIRGYTELTERLGAREVVELLNEYFTLLVDAVLQREGVVDKFMGDAMLCWFGAPVRQADHARRAVDACRDIMARLEDWNRRRVAEGLAPVGTGIGVATGDVIVGNIGSPERLEYTAIGDAVNLASRLCGKADAGQVLVTDTVRRAVPDIAFTEIGPVRVKGVQEPVQVHALA